MFKSLKELYIIAPGPSSSHTIGPYKACNDFFNIEIKNILKDINKIEVTLFGSLALTGKGHLTDKIIIDTLSSLIKNNKFNIEVLVHFNVEEKDLIHPNTLTFEAKLGDKLLKRTTYYSIGGGEIVKNNIKARHENYIYPFSSFKDILDYMKKNNIKDLKDVIDNFEDKSVDEYLDKVIKQMFKCLEDGLSKDGNLPGKLNLERVSKTLYNNIFELEEDEGKLQMLLTAFSYAVSEENASGSIIVTSPTCGSSGIIPSILYYHKKVKNIDDKKLIDGLKVASIFGNLAKENATISGAVGGCQAEIGVASSMGAALFSYLNDLSIYQIEYAAELALEHFLGLTCDPVGGYVQIPCIERNGIGVLRSYSAYLYSKNIAPIRKNRVSFDEVLKTMKMTGDDLLKDYKETSVGGLAKIKDIN